MKKISKMFMILVFCFLVTSCRGFMIPGSAKEPENIQTRVAETVAAVVIETRVARLQTEMVRKTQPTSTVSPSITVFITPSLTATPTLEPTSTNTPSLTPSNSATFRPENRARFIDDISVQDNSIFTPQERFIKIWRVENVGTNTWASEYSLVFIGGESLGARTVIPFPYAVPPGGSVDLSVQMEAPRSEGSYFSEWKIRDQNGVLFGMGNADFPLDVRIQVVQPNPAYEYEFAIEVCEADWSSQAGLLPCQGDQESTAGFVSYLENPALENRRENEPTLWVRPNRGSGGWIRGIYPSVFIERNDHFLAWVGCLENNPDCDLTFQLAYFRGDGPIRIIEEWRQVYDGRVETVDLDLTGFENQFVQFVLTVFNHGSFADANGFWFVPRIQNILPTQTPHPSPSSTPTPTQTPTSTPTPTPTPTFTLTLTQTLNPTSTPTQTPSPPYRDDPAVRKAVQVFASEIGTSTDEVFIFMARPAEWPDTCLGLPEEEEICAPQVVPGYLVIVRYDRGLYEIRTDQDSNMVRWRELEFFFQ